VFIAPDEVLTAAHVVWESGVGAATSITVVPGENGISEPYGAISGVSFHYFTINDAGDFLSFDQIQSDFAVIHLASPIGNTTGIMGYESNFGGGAVHSTGFPANLGSNIMMDTTATIVRDPAYTIFDMPGGTLSPGDSGGPVWTFQNGQPYVVGINSAAGSGIDYAGQITSSIFNTIEAWVAADDGGSPAPPPPSIPFDLNWQLAAVDGFQISHSADLVWRRVSDGFVEIQFLSGNTPRGGGAIANNPFDGSWRIGGRADFNGDGHLDLLWHRPSDGLTEIQFLNGTTPIGGGTIVNSAFDSNWEVTGTGDFNGDGNADLLWQRQSDGLSEIELLNGLDSAGGGVIANNPFGVGWSIAAVGDFNGDGKSDLVWRRSDGLTEIQLLNSNQAIGGGVIQNSPFDSSWSIVGSGFFNGDSKEDLVWQRPSDGLTEIQYLDGNTAIGGGVVSGDPFDSSWALVGVGNFKGYGGSDLVYRRSSDGLVEVLFLEGLSPAGGGATASTDDLVSAGQLAQLTQAMASFPSQDPAASSSPIQTSAVSFITEPILASPVGA